MSIKNNKINKALKEKFEFWLDEHRWAAIILGVVALGAVTSVAICAPNILQLFGKRKKQFNKKEERLLAYARNRLLRQGAIKKRYFSDGRGYFEITKKGYKKLNNYNFQHEIGKHKKKKYWDNKWRLLLFDYPNTEQSTRDKIRKIAKSFGFYQFQKNVWVYPYENAEEMLDYFYLLYGKGNDRIAVIMAERFVGDVEICRHFDL